MAKHLGTISRFALQAPKRELRNDVEYVNFDAKIISDILNLVKCPICLEVVSNTVSTECCLNRFCRPCIVKYLQQMGSAITKECPMCKHQTNHRKLKTDETLTKLVPLLSSSSSSAVGATTESAETISSAEDATTDNAVSSQPTVENEDNALDVKAAKLRYQEQVLMLRKLARDRQRKQEELRASLAASLEYTKETAEQVQGKVVISLFKHPSQGMVPAFPFKYVRTSVSTTLADVKQFICHIVARGYYRNQLHLYIVSPVVAKVSGAAGGTNKQLLYALPNDNVTLGELEAWCIEHSLPLNILFRLN